MSKSESQQLLADLIEYAEAGNKLHFEFIRNWKHYKKCKMSRRAFLTIIESLEYAASSLLNRYCEGLKKGTADFTDLLARKSLLKSVEFYKCEVLMLEDMLYEYGAYLMCGNLLWAFLGKERKGYEMYDHREDI